MNHLDYNKINYWYKDTTIDCCNFKLININTDYLELDTSLNNNFNNFINQINQNQNNNNNNTIINENKKNQNLIKF